MNPKPLVLYIGVKPDGSEGFRPAFVRLALTPMLLMKTTLMQHAVVQAGVEGAWARLPSASWDGLAAKQVRDPQLCVSANDLHLQATSAEDPDVVFRTYPLTHDRLGALVREAAGKGYLVHECDEAELIEAGLVPDATPVGP